MTPARSTPAFAPRARRRWAAGLGLLAPFLLSACSQLYTLEVESSRLPESGGTNLDAKSYYVTSIRDTSAIDGGRLRNQEAARIVAEALAVRGMYQAPSAAHAEVLLEISYGRGPAKIEVSELTNPARGHVRTLVADEVREKSLTLTARAPGPTDPGAVPEVLWTVHVRTRDDNTDQLRKYLPVLAEVAATWASRNSHGTRSFTATLQDGVLIYVSGGYEQPGVAHLPE